MSDKLEISESQREALNSVSEPLIALAKSMWGETEYKYYALPIRWSQARKQHIAPITGLEDYEVSAKKYEANIEQSKRKSSDAFFGKLKTSYTRYERRISNKGWRENLSKAFKKGLIHDD